MLVPLWVGLSVVAGALFALGAVQVARARRRWGRTRVAGWDVRIAPAFGPAVVGVRRPEIVLPQWALALDEASLELVLGHEQEHLEGRDTLLLSAAFLIAASAPWNPFLWLQLRRLRMAVELDCDARVLRGGADRRRYGALLLHVGERGPRMSIAAAALAEPTSFLERRLRMITESRRRGDAQVRCCAGRSGNPVRAGLRGSTADHRRAGAASPGGGGVHEPVGRGEGAP